MGVLVVAVGAVAVEDSMVAVSVVEEVLMHLICLSKCFRMLAAVADADRVEGVVLISILVAEVEDFLVAALVVAAGVGGEDSLKNYFQRAVQLFA